MVYGKRGNDKRKRCAALKLNISLNDLAVKLRIHGRHPMLSYLSSLPIARERGGVVVERRTPNLEVLGSNPTSVIVLCP